MDIPVLTVMGECLPEAWERAVIAVATQGCEIKTEYDKPEDPPSRDATVQVIVSDPLAEPRIHKNFPGGPVELEVYRQEVVEGIHDHWIAPEEGKWTYTYHQRLFRYLSSCVGKYVQPSFTGDRDIEDQKRAIYANVTVNQIDYIVEKLSSSPYSRRAQAVTWDQHFDPQTDDPPCLQRVWCRLLPQDGYYVLNMNTYWRSRDLWKAWFMNAFVLTDLMRQVMKGLADQLNMPVRCGRYVDTSDSLHIYGSDMDDKYRHEFAKVQDTHWQERAWETSVLEPMFEEARENLAGDPDYYAKGDDHGSA